MVSIMINPFEYTFLGATSLMLILVRGMKAHLHEKGEVKAVFSLTCRLLGSKTLRGGANAFPSGASAKRIHIDPRDARTWPSPV